MKIRIAKHSDAAAIAELYIDVASQMGSAYLGRLGRRFLRLNYELLISEQNGVVLCVENGLGEIVGFVSGSLQIEEHFSILSRRKIEVGLACLGAFLCHPSLVRGAIQRFRAIRHKNDNAQFVVMSGPRIEFWACKKDSVSGVDSVQLLKAWLTLAELGGCSEVKCEVDEANKRVLQLHQALGAKVVEQFKTSDGRARRVLKYAF